MNEKNLLAITRGAKHIKLVGATTLIGLFASQSVYAADDSSTIMNLGVPTWVWLLIIIALLVAVTLMPKKWIDPKTKNLDKKAPTPTPVAKAPATTPKPKQETPKVEAKPVVTPVTPPVAVAPVVVPPVAESTPPAAVKEVLPEKPVETDALVEAKQLLSQQRFPQAVGVLNKGLQKDPKRSDLMLQLLEIYLKQNDHEAFDIQFAELQKLDDPIALIQAEELHHQLERPIVVEESDAIEYDATKAVIPEPEEAPAAVTHDYAADSLAFTSEKEQVEGITPQSASVALDQASPITPVGHDFSLDDIDVQHTTANAKEDISAKSASDDFDFSSFDLNVPEAPKKPVIVEKVPSLPTAEPAAPVDLSTTTPMVDLDFDFDDSFAIDEDKQEAVKSEKSSWANDLADETFALPTAEPTAAKEHIDPFATEVAPEPVVAAPVAPKVVEPVKKDLATSLEEEFPFLQSVDTYQTRLDLARNYIELGEIGSARELLTEVAEQGASTQQTEARELIAKLAS